MAAHSDRHSRRFQSTLPVWGATPSDYVFTPTDQFQSTLPVWGATSAACLTVATTLDFNPRSPCGERPILCAKDKIMLIYFNPRSPCGERQLGYVKSGVDDIFQSTLPVWGATILCQVDSGRSLFQSTLPVWGATHISRGYRQGGLFQSTLPVWGATHKTQEFKTLTKVFQSTLPVWGATQHSIWVSGFRAISIHAPRVGSDGDRGTPHQTR